MEHQELNIDNRKFMSFEVASHLLLKESVKEESYAVLPPHNIPSLSTTGLKGRRLGGFLGVIIIQFKRLIRHVRVTPKTFHMLTTLAFSGT